MRRDGKASGITFQRLPPTGSGPGTGTGTGERQTEKLGLELRTATGMVAGWSAAPINSHCIRRDTMTAKSVSVILGTLAGLALGAIAADAENRVKELHEEVTITEITELCKELGSDDAELRREAFLTLNRLGPAAAPAVPMLISILESSTDMPMRGVAATILGHIGVAAQPALPALERAIAVAIREARNAKQNILRELRKAGRL